MFWRNFLLGAEKILTEIIESMATESLNIQSCGLEIIDTYELRMKKIAEIMDGIFLSIRDFNSELIIMVARLRENLAMNSSLRKKDFDSLIGVVFMGLAEREKCVIACMADFRESEEDMIRRLREIVCTGAFEPYKFTVDREEILKRQRERERELSKAIRSYQSAQQELREALKGLVKRRDGLKISHLRDAISKLRVNPDKYEEILWDELWETREKVHKEWRALMSRRGFTASLPLKTDAEKCGIR